MILQVHLASSIIIEVQLNEDYTECKKILISIVRPLLVGKSCLDISATETARKYHLLLKIKKEI
jgi:hypothetical protein